MHAVRCFASAVPATSWHLDPQRLLARGAGLRIQRMSAAPGDEFGDPSSYPYMTVASPSCHDTSTTRAWYEEDADRRQRFWQQVGDLCCHKPVP